MTTSAPPVLLESARFSSGEEHDETHGRLDLVDVDLRARVGEPSQGAAPASGLYAEIHDLRGRIAHLEVSVRRAGLVGVAIGTALASLVERWIGALLGPLGGGP